MTRSLAWQARFDSQIDRFDLEWSLLLQGEPAASLKGVPTKRLLGVVLVASVVSLAAVGRVSISRATDGADADGAVRVRLQPRVVEYGPVRVSVSGISAAAVSVRPDGANDLRSLAYQWTPYRWRQLRLVGGRWCGVLPAPPLLGIYRLQFRVRQPRRLLQSPHWLLRVLPPGTLNRPAFATPLAVIRDFVSDLPGNQVLVVARPWAQAAFDHRDPRLNRAFVIAYAPRRNNTPSARLGLFITTVRDGYHGRWRLLEATTEPPD